MYLWRVLVFSLCYVSASATASQQPNFVFILADDLGYGDLQCYGHPIQEHGPVDELASGGMRFTQWYAAETLCTPSRAALLTGRYPIRSGFYGPQRVFTEEDAGGLPKSTVTFAEALKDHGYATGIVGKWHLGINEFERNDGNHLPHNHGFSYVGHILPFTHIWLCNPEEFSIDRMKRRCFVVRGKDIVEQPINASLLAEKMMTDAVEFIEQNRNDTFFLYLSLPHVHSKVFCSAEFCGKSRRGIYGDNINEMSWIVGEVVNTLKRLELHKDTLVFFVSDNGPQTEMCLEGGSTGGLRGSKASTWDGGIRVPSIAWWPGRVPAGSVNRDVISMMDIFPTLLELADIPPRKGLDGVSIADVLLGKRRDVPLHDVLFHYCSDEIMAVRIGPYKIHYRTQVPNPSGGCVHGKPWRDLHNYFSCELSRVHNPPVIFNMDLDPNERYALNASLHEDLIFRASELIAEHKRSIVHVPSVFGKRDPKLRSCCNPPSCVCNYLSSTYKDEL